jgi:hypothetical protein
MSGMGGILAVLNDLDAGCDRAAYEDWYQRDHLPDRLAVPGFRHARRYRRVEGALAEYFTFYETDGAEVLRSAAYRARLAAPTAGTVAMMRHFRAMCRSVCVVTAEAGGGIGGLVAVVGSAVPVAGDGAGAVLRALLGHGAVSRARLWRAAEDVADNPEAALRPGADGRLGSILVVVGTDASALRDAAGRGAAALGLAGDTGLYGLMFADGIA